jgi:transposase
MFYDFKVPVPDIPGKITTRKKGASIHVAYQYDRIYHPEKHYNVPQRAVIGKIFSQDESMMFPNEKYLEFFPDTVIPEVRPFAYRSCCLRIGSYLIISKVMEEYQLPQMLRKWLGKDCGLFLDLVAFSIITEDNAGMYYPDFAFCHPLFSEKMKIYSDSSVSRLLGSLRKDQSIGFLDAWNMHRDHRQRIYISYDSTNKNCQAGDVEIVEFGKAKDNKALPVFNLAIAFDKTNKVPLFYEEYPGSINDVSQFTFMVDKVIEYGYRRIGFILDRGYFSKENIRYMDEQGYNFIIMVKGVKSLVRELVTSRRGTFETDRDCSIRAYRVYGTTVKRKLYADDEHDRWFHVYHNPGKQAAERERLELQLERQKQFFEKLQGQKIEFSSTFSQYFDIFHDKNEIFLYAREKKEVIQADLELCGYFVIVTSEKMSAEEALVLYKSRDSLEKLFSSDKTFLGARGMRVHSQESVSAKLFIEFVALIIRNRMYTLLKDEVLRLDLKRNYMIVPAALRELEKIEMVRRSTGEYRLDHAVTKTQKTILQAFGLDERYVQQKATEIGKLLENSSSMLHISHENGGDEDGTDQDDFIC